MDTNNLKKELYKIIQNDASVFDLLLDSGINATWIWDLENHEKAWVNPNIWSWLGYSADTESSFMREVIHPEDLDKAQEVGQRSMQEGINRFQLEQRLKHKNGIYKWVKTQCIIIWNNEGIPYRMIGVYQDITDLKTDNHLTSKSKKYGYLVEGTDSGTWELDLISGKANYNHIWAEIIGFKLEELKPLSKNTWAERVHPEDLRKCEKQLNAHVNGETDRYTCTHRMKHKDGHWVWVLARGKVFEFDEEGRSKYIFGTIIDISAQKEEELSATRNEKILTTLINNLPGTVYQNILYDDGTADILFGHKGIAELHGLEEQQIRDDPQMSMANVHPDDLQSVNEAIQKSLQDLTLFKSEFRSLSEKRGLRYLLSVGTPERVENGVIFYGYLDDITDRKLSEMESARNERLLSNMIENLPGTVYQFMMKDDGSIAVPFGHKGLAKLHGVKEEDVKSRAETIFETILPADLIQVQQSIQQSYQELTNWVMEYRINKNGVIRHISGISKPEKVTGGVLWHGYLDDITESVIEREKLERLNDLFIKTNELGRIGTWEVNLSDMSTQWSPITCEIHEVDYFDQTNVEKGISYYQGKYKEIITNAVDNAIQNGKHFDLEALIKTAKGNYRWIRAVGIPEFEDGKCKYLHGLFQDIHEKKMANQKLEEKSTELNRILSLVSVGIFKMNQHGELIFLSPVFYQMLEKQEEEVLGSVGNIYEYIHEDDIDLLKETISNALNKIQPFSARFRYRLQENLVWFELKSEPWLENSGEFIWFGTLTDVTEEIKSQHLLEVEKEKAEEASRFKSEFLANMSHEIRTPLNGIIGFTDLLMKTPLDGTQQEYMKTVNSSAGTLLGLINDILDFSKIEAGKLELAPEMTDLPSLGAEIAEITKYQAHQKQLELILNLPMDLPRYINIDPLRLRQVCINLLSNAIKFTRKGEVEFQVKVLDKLSDDRVKLRFLVRDTGIGIAKEKQEKIFEAFTQEDSSTTRQFGGTGLGLTISNKLLSMMDSQLSLKSTLGKGSTFYFDIDVDCSYEDQGDAIVDLGFEKVMIVDDNETNLRLLEDMLKIAGLKTISATNGFRALDILSGDEDVDLIIMDLHMPVMDGFETMDKINQLTGSWGKKIYKVILSSSSSSEEYKRKVDNLKIDLALVKPVQFESFLKALSKIKDSTIDTKKVKIEEESTEAVLKTDKQLKVLVAEDNELNMVLVRSFFERMKGPFMVYEATNGKSALQKFKALQPDIVLTDIQMPEMNGYELARQVRKLEEGKDTIIIALTAGALEGDREKALNAGMDDYMSKPIKQDDFQKTLIRWTDKITSAEIVRTEIEDQANNKIDELNQLVNGDTDALRHLLAISEKMFIQGKTLLGEAIHNNEHQAIKAQAHKIKGSALALGFKELADVCLDMEMNATSNKKNLEKMLDRYIEESDKVVDILRSYQGIEA